MDSEEPGVGYLFITILLIVTVVIVLGIVLYIKHVHSF